MIDHARELEEMSDMMREACFRASPLFKAIRHMEAVQKAHPVPKRIALNHHHDEFTPKPNDLGEMLNDLESKRIKHHPQRS